MSVHETIGTTELLDRVRDVWDGGRAAMAFDADGTLWRGDVGDDVFRGAIERGALRPEALPALKRLANRLGVAAPDDDANSAATALLQSYHDGICPEETVCEVMTWCYAGMTLGAVRSLASDIVGDVTPRLIPQVMKVIEWARTKDIRCVIVSASPRAVVEACAAAAGFRAEDVRGATPAVTGQIIQPAMAEPVPYGPRKRVVVDELLDGAALLAGFGDSGFDADLLERAEIGVAVAPNASLSTLCSERQFVEIIQD